MNANAFLRILCYAPFSLFNIIVKQGIPGLRCAIYSIAIIILLVFPLSVFWFSVLITAESRAKVALAGV